MAAILTSQLLIPPIVGLADNGDFERVMGWAGLRYPSDNREDNFVSWMLPQFAIVRSDWHPGAYLTSEAPVAAVAVLAARIFSEGDLFDVRVLGCFHMILLLAAAGSIIAACRNLSLVTQWLVAGLIVFVFTDIGYAAPLNSLYSQTASLLFLMLTVAVVAVAIRRGRLDGALLIAYFLCATLFVCSKPQESLQGPLLAALGLGLAGWRRVKGWWRRPAVWLALGLCAVSLLYYRLTPRWLQPLAVYNSLFRELLPNSPDAARDLAELGLDPSLIKHLNSDPYVPESPLHDPSFRAKLFPRFGYRALLGFYLSHPRRLASRIQRGAESAFHLRPLVLGNFAKARGMPPGTKATQFAWWSNLRLKLTPHALFWLSLILVGNLVAAELGYRHNSKRAQLFPLAVAVLALMACVEFMVAVLADEIGDIARHLFVFHALCDLLLIADAGWLTQALVERTRSSAAAPRMASGG